MRILKIRQGHTKRNIERIKEVLVNLLRLNGIGFFVFFTVNMV